MAKSFHDDIVDAALNHIKTYGDMLCLCEGVPDDYADISNHHPITWYLQPSGYIGPQDAETGRKLSIPEWYNLAPSGNYTYHPDTILVVDSSESKILYIGVVETMSEGFVYDSTDYYPQNKIHFRGIDIVVEDPT